MPGPLENSRHEKFCQEIMTGKTQVAAYLAAGFKGSDADKNSLGNANRVFSRPDVKARLAELKAAQADRYQVTTDRITRELALLAFSNMADYAELSEHGDLTMLPRDQTAAITEFTVDTITSGRGDDRETRRRCGIGASQWMLVCLRGRRGSAASAVAISCGMDDICAP